MRKTLLAGASLAVMFTAVNALAAEYTGDVDTTITEGDAFYVEAGSTIKDATFDVTAEGTGEADSKRIGFVNGGNITISGDNTLRDFVIAYEF